MNTKLVSVNPATNELLWEGSSASPDDIDKAIANAKKAFLLWSETPYPARKEAIEHFTSILDQNKSSLAEVISQETGKPLWDSLGEVQSMINKGSISIAAFEERCAEKHAPQSPIPTITRYKPHGAVAVFGPFNFPGHLPNGHIIPALLAGNTVIWKPSEFTPLVAETIYQLWGEVRLPPGTINLVQGGPETGKALAGHPGINGLFFTGSVKTGCALSKQLGANIDKILALELGGNNPLVVWDVADTKAAAYLTIMSAYLSSGQRCTCARRLILPQNEFGETFLKLVVFLTKQLRIGRYNDLQEPFMGPLISRVAAENLLKAQQGLIAKGAKTVLETRLFDSTTAFVTPGLIDVTNIPNRPDEELFGPLLQVIFVSSFSDAIDEANNTSYGLVAGLISDRRDYFEQFYRKVRAGIINWNTALTGASSRAPFGGVGMSGNHRPSGYYAADYCSYPVASMELSHLQMPSNIPPGIESNHV